MEYNYIVYGNPAAQKRHRHFNRGKFTQTYDPSKTDKQDFVSQIIQQRPKTPFVYPLIVSINFYFNRPKSHYGSGKNADKLKQSAPFFHTSKPDIDNLIKFVLDAMNGIFFKDDYLITKIKSEKNYSDTPRTTIKIIAMEAE